MTWVWQYQPPVGRVHLQVGGLATCCAMPYLDVILYLRQWGRLVRRSHSHFVPWILTFAVTSLGTQHHAQLSDDVLHALACSKQMHHILSRQKSLVCHKFGRFWRISPFDFSSNGRGRFFCRAHAGIMICQFMWLWSLTYCRLFTKHCYGSVLACAQAFNA